MAAVFRTVGVIFVVICVYFTTIVKSHQEENVPAPAVAASLRVRRASGPTVYMAEANITVVGESKIDRVPIHIIQSEAVNYTTTFNIYLDYDGSVSRYAYLYQEYLEIEAGDQNTTTYLEFEDDYSVRFEDEVYNITLSWCSSCSIGSPQTTTVTVRSSDVVNVTFNRELDYTYEEYCHEPEYCYRQINIRTDYYLQDEVTLPLKVEPNGTATYLVDYYFDSDPPEVTLESYSTYHYLKVYIRDDQMVEENEYFHLSFDEENFPDNFVAGGIRTISYLIQDNDYAQLFIKGDHQTYSEADGSVEIIVETNVVRDYPMLINISMYPTYDDKYSSALPGEDFVPFYGLYYIPAGENSTTINVTLIDDDLAEQEERLGFGVSLVVEDLDIEIYDYTLIRIEDDETKNNPLVFSFANSSVVVSESVGTLKLYLTANLKTNSELLLEYFPSEGNGMVEYRDYSAFFNATVRRDVIVFDRSSEYVIEMTIIDDCDVEGTEEVTLAITNIAFGRIDPEYQNLTVVVEDNDITGDVHCPACACSGGGGDTWTTDSPTSDPDPVPLMFYFEMDEINIYEGECSFYDIIVKSTRPTNATVFIGIQPWELTYGEDFTISDKKLVFENSDWKNFSFRALQDMEDEDTESTLVNIAYVSEGEIGPWNAILVNVLDESDSLSGSKVRIQRSVEDFEETRSENLASTTLATGLLAGLVSSLFVVIATGLLLGISLVVRRKK